MSENSNWRSGSGADLQAKTTRLLDRIPGYRGYRDKEGRRDADRLVREETSAAFGRQADRVEAVARDLANRRLITQIGPVESLSVAIRHLADRIRTASYGYAPLFSDRTIDERALDQLRLFDDGLISGIADLDAPISALEAALAANSDHAKPATEGASVVRTLGQRLDLRNQVMTSGEPAPEASVLAVLNTQPPPKPHPAFALNQGDAVSILGDNFIVDARIDIAAGEQSVRLFRLQSGPPGRWLLVPLDATLAFADLTDTDATAETAQMTDVLTGSGTGEIAGTSDASGQRPVRFQVSSDNAESGARSVSLDWGNEVQHFKGKSVHPNDIEVFGATSRT